MCDFSSALIAQETCSSCRMHSMLTNTLGMRLLNCTTLRGGETLLFRGVSLLPFDKLCKGLFYFCSVAFVLNFKQFLI